MPLPNCLHDIAFDESNKNNFTTFRIRCKCGCLRFNIYESYLNKEEKKLCKPYYDALDYSIRGGCFSNCTIDENGIMHHWIYLTQSRDGPKEEVFIPPKPICAAIKVIKVKCSECGREYVIYDSRISGYSGKCCNNYSKEEKEYNPHFRLKKRRDNLPVEICIKVEHDTYEEFEKITGISLEYDDYTDAFTWIVIYSIDSADRKRKLY